MYKILYVINNTVDKNCNVKFSKILVELTITLAKAEVVGSARRTDKEEDTDRDGATRVGHVPSGETKHVNRWRCEK